MLVSIAERMLASGVGRLVLVGLLIAVCLFFYGFGCDAARSLEERRERRRNVRNVTIREVREERRRLND